MINDLKTAVDVILGGAAILQSANGAGRIFELFIMTGVATRLQGLGFDVWLQRSDGSRISPTDSDRRFIQRGGCAPDASWLPSPVESDGVTTESLSVSAKRRCERSEAGELNKPVTIPRANNSTNPARSAGPHRNFSEDRLGSHH